MGGVMVLGMYRLQRVRGVADGETAATEQTAPYTRLRRQRPD
jgi:hypothetical protein